MAESAVVARVCVRVVKMRTLVFLCVCIVISWRNVLTETQKTCDELYREGIDAYLEERWQDCIGNLEHALKEYRSLKQTTVNCRLKCQMEAEDSSLMSPINTEDLQFYEKMIRKTLCLLKCNKYQPRNGQNAIPKETEKDFEDRKPYEYLQLCYYQKNLLQKAASAVFTFLVEHPDNEVMLSNLKFYSSLPEVDMTEVVNYEARNYVSLYIHGSEAYHQEDYKSVISYIEESLEDYLRSEEECRAFCEGPFDQGWFPDYVSSIANHFTYCLKCKRRCPTKLNSLNGEKHEDLLPSHYHFLQYAYYKAGNLKKACEAVASYLIFYPVDETMLNNKEYYLKLPKVQEDYFTPREEAVKYVQRQEYEIKLLDFIETEFVFQDKDKDEIDNNINEKISSNTKTKSSIILAALSELKLFPPPITKFEWPKYEMNIIRKTNSKIKYKNEATNKNAYQSGSARITEEEEDHSTQEEVRRRKKRAVLQMHRAAAMDIKVVMGEKELKGKYRFVAEGFANETECNKLMQLAEVAAVQGDGYSGNKSPHTSFEKFEGVTLGRAAMLVYLGLIEVEILELYLNLSEMGRDYLERYFNLKSELYFTYTHLVCRTALSDSPNNRSDMSHAVHADNCNLLENGECTRKPPAYIWRDFSAIVYLNEDFKGGEFVFVKDIFTKHVQSIVKPRCGRMVGFSAGSENLHGVRGVLRGRRCAVGLWFTFNPFYEEIEHVLAKQVLLQVQQGGSITDQLLHELRKYVVSQPPTAKEAVNNNLNIYNKKKTSVMTSKGQVNIQNTFMKGTVHPKEEQHGTTKIINIERHKDRNVL